MADDIRLKRRRLYWWSRDALESYQQVPWQPPADIYRTAGGWLVKFDLAGVHPEDVELEVEGCRLTIRGQRSDWMCHETQHAYSMEISYNRFERVLQLPCDAQKASVASEYCDGMLVVRLEMEEP